VPPVRDFQRRSAKANKPFLPLAQHTRTHVWTHLAPKWQKQEGYGLYADASMELGRGGRHSIMKKLDDAGLDKNIVVLPA